MSDQSTEAEMPDCGADAAAYALGALTAQEAEAFRAHLADCVVCRDEVSAFGAVVDVLPLAAPPQRVPRSLRRRVLAEVGAEAGGRRAPRRRQRRIPRSHPLGVWAGGLATAAAVALVLVLSTGGGSGTRVLKAGTAFPGAQAQLRIGGGHAELIFQRMPPPPPGRVYEVWIKRGSQAPIATSALFSTTRSGAGVVDVPASLSGVSQIMVTPEPVGGSRTPTRPAVVVANL